MLVVIMVTYTGYAQQNQVSVGLVGRVHTIDPIFCLESENSYQVSSMMFRGLVGFDQEDMLYLDLAESIEESVNHLNNEWELTVEIRDCAHWSDGTRVSASDVQFTIDVLRHPGTVTEEGKSNPWYRKVRHILETRILSDRSIIIVFDSEVFDYKGYLTFGILPEHVLNPEEELSPSFVEGDQRLLELSVGNGPYIIAGPGQYSDSNFLMRRNNYYHCEPYPILDGFWFMSWSNATTLAENLKSNTVQYAKYLPILKVNEFEGHESFNVFKYSEHSFKAISMNACKGPFRDLALRRALALAIDRERIIASIYNNQGAVSIDKPYMSGSQFGTSLFLDLEYDRELAIDILDSLDIRDVDGDGIREYRGTEWSLDLIYWRESNEDERIRTNIVDDLSRIGLRVEAIGRNLADFQTNLANRTFDLALWTPKQTSGPDLSALYSPDGFHNYGCYDNSEANSLMSRIIETNEMQRLKELTAELDVLLANDIPLIFLVRPTPHGCAHQYLQGYSIGGFNLMDRTNEWYFTN